MYFRTRWTSHKGEKILHADFSGLKDDQLMDVSRLKLQDQLPDELANLAVLRSKTTIFTAILGIQGIPHNLVNLLLPDIELVDTITEGKEWLVKESNRL